MWGQILQGLLGGGASGAFSGGGGFGQGQQQQPQFNGQDAAQNVGVEAAQLNNQMEFGTAGTPPSLSNQLNAEALARSTPQPQFSQFYSPMVLPDRGDIAPPPVQPFDPFANGGMQPPQQYNVGASSPVPQGGMPFQAPPQQMQPPQPGQQPGFGDLFNLTGTPQDPNIFLRLAEGYNRGGVVGAIGSALTHY